MLLLLALAGSAIVSACGAETAQVARPLAKPVTSAIDDWVRTWRPSVKASKVPSRFTVPAPPAVTLGRFADDIGRSVDESAQTVGFEVGVAYAQAKRVYCFWFAWYIETGRVVPTQQEFPGLLLEYGFGLVPVAPSTQFFNAVELFRDSIERAQSAPEAAANAATAAACSLRLGR